ncbi:MAG: DUF1854 domain-containing protein [Planctomycetota bacterium]|jgi:hypothetical protein
MCYESETCDQQEAAKAAAPCVERIERNDAGQLIVHLAGGGEPIIDVKLVRYFPWSLPSAYISVRDGEGREVVMLESLDDLDPASREVASRELEEKVFNPKITRILQHKREFGITNVTAETDRGPVEFQFHGRDDVRILSSTRALFRDVDGNTYEIADLSQMDTASRRYLNRYF